MDIQKTYDHRCAVITMRTAGSPRINAKRTKGMIWTGFLMMEMMTGER